MVEFLHKLGYELWRYQGVKGDLEMCADCHLLANDLKETEE